MNNLFEICSITLFLCAFLWLKNQRNQRNPWLINDLRVFGISTTVERSLQINLFMQNEPNFQKSQMNVNKEMTRDYDKMDTWSIGKNEPKTNPNEPKTNPNEPKTNPKRTQNKPNSNPIQTQNKPNSKPILVRHLCGGAEPKMNVSSVFTRNYEQFTMNNELKNKPNQNQPVVSLPALSAAEGSNLFQDLIYPQKPVKNYLSIALFPLTSGPARDYNGIFSILYISGEIQMKGVGNE